MNAQTILKMWLAMTCSAVMATAGTVRLVWDPAPPEEQVIEYRVYEKIGETRSLIGTSTNASFDILNVPPETRHVYTVTATNFWGESAHSNEAMTPPAATKRTITTIVRVDTLP